MFTFLLLSSFSLPLPSLKDCYRALGKVRRKEQACSRIEKSQISLQQWKIVIKVDKSRAFSCGFHLFQSTRLSSRLILGFSLYFSMKLNLNHPVTITPTAPSLQLFPLCFLLCMFYSSFSSCDLCLIHCISLHLYGEWTNPPNTNCVLVSPLLLFLVEPVVELYICHKHFQSKLPTNNY